mmetsp:Transcript_26321/g.102789  ORF Transcript_26321/g.102789 Transcript_26321/m.102789 type:complete len:365 (-) Transcript_26321:72-1166(-)
MLGLKHLRKVTIQRQAVVVFNATARLTHTAGSFSPGNESVSIDPLRMNLRDTKLLKVYSMSTCRNIIAAGGKNGYVSVFRLDQTETPEEEDASFISSKLHTGWISEVKLVELDDGVKVALLTASNDGSISLWNPASVDVERKTPECLFTCVDMHTRGIFSFDVSNRRILTGSKDCTIGLGRIESTGMTNISSFHDHHDGVVKCVRWRNPDEFASGGNDGRIILSDVRMKAPKAVTIESAQDGAVNSIDWSPTDCNYLISSGFDPSVHLWDVRNPKSYSLSFEGHTFKARSSTIHHPRFLSSGSSIVCTGEASNRFSFYCTTTGACRARPQLSSTPSFILPIPHENRNILAAAFTREISFFNVTT